MKRNRILMALALLAALAPRVEAQRMEVFSFAERRAWFGFNFEPIETRRPGERVLTLTVTSVVKDSPAEKAGLKQNDVILRINGLNATEQLLGTLGSSLEPDDTVTFQVRRDGSERALRIVAAKPPPQYARQTMIIPRKTMDSVRGMARIFIDSARVHMDTMFFGRMRPFADSVFGRAFIWTDSLARDTVRLRALRESVLRLDSTAGRWLRHDSIFLPRGERTFEFIRPGELPGHDIVIRTWAGGLRAIAGAELQELNPELARYFRVSSGVLVVNVPENTPARRAGLRAGDVITAVDGAVVTDIVELRRRIERAATGTVKLQVTREGERRTVELRR